MTAGRGKPSPVAVDWRRIRDRLEAIRRAIAGESSAAPEEVRRILEARARELARPVSPSAPGDRFEAVLFGLAGETYALEATYVWEVFRLTALSRLPGAEPPLFGVTAWRGAPLALLDLRHILGLPTPGVTDLSHVIVLGAQRPALGLLAEEVREVVSLRWEDAHEPAEGVAVKREFLQGITTEAVLVLDAAELLRRHRRVSLGGRNDAPGG